MENLKFKTKGSILTARSIEEIYDQKSFGYVPSTYVVYKKDGIYLPKNTAVYDTEDIGENFQCIKISYEDEVIILDMSKISHSFVYSNVDTTDYYGPMSITQEPWSKMAAIGRKDFSTITLYLCTLLQSKINFTNGKKEEADKEVEYLKPLWVSAFERDFLSMNIVTVAENYFDAIARNKNKETPNGEDEFVVDLYFEFQKETQEIIKLSHRFLLTNLKSEFKDLDEEEKSELRELLEENEAYEFYPLIDLK